MMDKYIVNYKNHIGCVRETKFEAFDRLMLSLPNSLRVLVERLEDDDDVQKVYHNLEITSELLNEL